MTTPLKLGRVVSDYGADMHLRRLILVVVIVVLALALVADLDAVFKAFNKPVYVPEWR